MRKQSGFTLIELMIVVAIVGILAAIAIPAYQDFQIRSKVSEVLASMGACKTKVTDFYDANNSQWVTRGGTTITAADLCDQEVTAYVGDIVVDAAGLITATIENLGGTATAGQIIEMAPTINNNAITGWICGGGGTDVEAKYRPGSCQG